MKKRVHRKRRTSHRKGTVMGRTGTFLMVICFSVLAGYMTATYLIGPALGLESRSVFFDQIKSNDNIKKQEEKSKETTENRTVLEDQVEHRNADGFALQYGSFSVRKGAQQCADELRADGIETEIIEKDGSFKVIGRIFETKEEARKHKEQTGTGDEVFITEIP